MTLTVLLPIMSLSQGAVLLVVSLGLVLAVWQAALCPYCS